MIFPKAAVLFLATTSSLANAGCPFLKSKEADSKNEEMKTIQATHQKLTKPVRRRRQLDSVEDTGYSNQRVGDGGIPDGGYAAVRDDIKVLLSDSKPEWPGDFESPTEPSPSYGGLFIRLAWHCNGSYRTSDGRGGCDGGDIRFDPVASWPDNASLDEALKLLQPIKDKYGAKLSWGDLIVLAGDTAIETYGGPVIGFCGGRIDNSDGTESTPLGPTQLQQDLMPCGDEITPVGTLTPGCKSPLGAAFMGLIYVNPEGADGHPGELEPSANSIREVFGRMGFDDRATVAAIGGGHAFGKCHGACIQDSPGMCPGGNTWEFKRTSGLELQWTTTPTTWSNEYFNNLYQYNWTNFTGPGGALQWKPTNGPNIGMLTTDLALTADPEYDKLSKEYAADFTSLTTDFGKAWYQLMSRDVGPRQRCLGDELPPELQEWEVDLGPLSSDLPDFVPIRSAIQELIDSDSSNLSAFSQLALACSDTYRATDYRGGCNGARIRFSPESEWPYNVEINTSGALQTLEPIKEAYPDISYADLIVLAGQTAIESAGGNAMNFCGGRVDADDGDASDGLEFTLYNDNVYLSIMYDISNKGLSMYEGVALFAAPKDGLTTLSNQYFVDLKEGNGDFDDYAKALLEGDFAPIVDEYINDNDLFLSEFALAWNYMMTSDLFDGPTANACQGVNTPTLDDSEPTPSPNGTPPGPTPEPTSSPSSAPQIFLTYASSLVMVSVAFFWI